MADTVQISSSLGPTGPPGCARPSSTTGPLPRVTGHCPLPPVTAVNSRSTSILSASSSGSPLPGGRGQLGLWAAQNTGHVSPRVRMPDARALTHARTHVCHRPGSVSYRPSPEAFTTALQTPGRPGRPLLRQPLLGAPRGHRTEQDSSMCGAASAGTPSRGRQQRLAWGGSTISSHSPRGPRGIVGSCEPRQG